jgi:hypothetical protein
VHVNNALKKAARKCNTSLRKLYISVSKITVTFNLHKELIGPTCFMLLLILKQIKQTNVYRIIAGTMQTAIKILHFIYLSPTVY